MALNTATVTCGHLGIRNLPDQNRSGVDDRCFQARAFSTPAPGDWPTSPPTGYLGQLDPGFQRRLALEQEGVEAGDCDWYHSTVLADGTEVRGQWDLRGREEVYLGKVPVKGRACSSSDRPAATSTFWMEARARR